MTNKVTKTIEKIIEALREEQGNLNGDDDLIKLIEDGSGSDVGTYSSNRLDQATSVYEFTVTDEEDNDYEVTVETELFDDYEEQVDTVGEDDEAWDDFDLDGYYNSSKFANHAAEQLIDELQEWLDDYIKYNA